MAREMTSYRRSVPPALAASFPRYVEQELDKLGQIIDAQRAAIVALEARVAALETP